MDKIKQEQEEQMRSDYRAGDLTAICESCRREVETSIEKFYNFGGGICHKCYIEYGERQEEFMEENTSLKEKEIVLEDLGQRLGLI